MAAWAVPNLGMPAPGSSKEARVLPVWGSTFRVFKAHVEAIHRASFPYVMPLPWMDSVWISWITEPSP